MVLAMLLQPCIYIGNLKVNPSGHCFDWMQIIFSIIITREQMCGMKH